MAIVGVELETLVSEPDALNFDIISSLFCSVQPNTLLL